MGNKYVANYSGDYFSLPWYEKDLMRYYNYLEYQEMGKEPTEYFKKKKIINFNIIHHEARGDPMQGTYKDYHTIKKSDLREFLPWKKTLGGIIYNIKREDMNVDESKH